MIKIRSHQEGFRRCGVAHSREWTVFNDGAFSDNELEILMAEPMLVVDFVKEEKTPAPKKKTAKGTAKGNSGKPKKGS